MLTSLWIILAYCGKVPVQSTAGDHVLLSVVRGNRALRTPVGGLSDGEGDLERFHQLRDGNHPREAVRCNRKSGHQLQPAPRNVRYQASAETLVPHRRGRGAVERNCARLRVLKRTVRRADRGGL